LALELARDEMKKLERGSIRPLQVLEQDQKGLLGSEPAQKLREVPEKSGLDLGGIRVAQRTLALTARRESREEITQLGAAAPRQN
jgi:hypothetical protein